MRMTIGPGRCTRWPILCLATIVALARPTGGRWRGSPAAPPMPTISATCWTWSSSSRGGACHYFARPTSPLLASGRSPPPTRTRWPASGSRRPLSTCWSRLWVVAPRRGVCCVAGRPGERPRVAPPRSSVPSEAERPLEGRAESRSPACRKARPARGATLRSPAPHDARRFAGRGGSRDSAQRRRAAGCRARRSQDSPRARRGRCRAGPLQGPVLEGSTAPGSLPLARRPERGRRGKRRSRKPRDLRTGASTRGRSALCRPGRGAAPQRSDLHRGASRSARRRNAPQTTASQALARAPRFERWLAAIAARKGAPRRRPPWAFLEARPSSLGRVTRRAAHGLGRGWTHSGVTPWPALGPCSAPPWRRRLSAGAERQTGAAGPRDGGSAAPRGDRLLGGEPRTASAARAPANRGSAPPRLPMLGFARAGHPGRQRRWPPSDRLPALALVTAWRPHGVLARLAVPSPTHLRRTGAGASRPRAVAAYLVPSPALLPRPRSAAGRADERQSG